MTSSMEPRLPGTAIQEVILARTNLTQADLARALDISKPRLNQIIRGRSPISPDVALRLEKVTSIRADYWLQLQASYSLYRARQRLSANLAMLTQIASLTCGPVERTDAVNPMEELAG